MIHLEAFAKRISPFAQFIFGIGLPTYGQGSKMSVPLAILISSSVATIPAGTGNK